MLNVQRADLYEAFVAQIIASFMQFSTATQLKEFMSQQYRKEHKNPLQHKKQQLYCKFGSLQHMGKAQYPK
jgi:hypothetical protein